MRLPPRLFSWKVFVSSYYSVVLIILAKVCIHIKYVQELGACCSGKWLVYRTQERLVEIFSHIKTPYFLVLAGFI